MADLSEEYTFNKNRSFKLENVACGRHKVDKIPNALLLAFVFKKIAGKFYTACVEFVPGTMW